MTAAGEDLSGGDAQRSLTGIQSLERGMRTLETIAAHGGTLGVSEIAARSGIAVATIHRIVRTLVDLGYLRQEATRRYALGPRLLVLADRSSSILSDVARPHLTRLVDELGETANLALLDDGHVTYVAQVPSRHAMRMFTEVGNRVLPHCTAVGKALLAGLPPDKARVMLLRNGMPRRTEHTVTQVEVLLEQLRRVARDGLAVDDGEQEIGVRCVAVPVPLGPVRLAISVSGPAPRMDAALLDRAAPVLKEVAAALAADLS